MAHWRETPSHGWLVCSPGELARMPEFARRVEYEEDCEWSIAVVALPELTYQDGLFYGALEAIIDNAKSTCRDYYPDIFEKLTGEIATPDNSMRRAENKFYADHENDWVVICASGDWKEGVPRGMVECVATRGGRRHDGAEMRIFYVKKDDYVIGRFGYVIREES